jgi:hypothetical protein
MTACQSSGRRSQRVATRRQLRSQLLVRSTCQRCRPCGSAPLIRWRLPRQTLRVAVPGGIGSPFRRGAADPRGDPASAQLRLQLGRGVAAVGPELGGPQAALEQLVDERQQLAPLVLVGGPDPDREGGAARLDG